MKRFVTRWNGEVVAGYDMLLAWGVIMLALFILAAPPRPKAADSTVPPGSLIVTLYWPDDQDADIDLWVLAPGGGKPVGYSNPKGRYFDLVRDDLGFTNDDSGRNFEIAYSRELPPGEYVINAHAYSVRSARLPIPIKLVVQQHMPGESTVTLATVDAELKRGGEELTLIRFRLSKQGLLVPGSINHLPMELRSR